LLLVSPPEPVKALPAGLIGNRGLTARLLRLQREAAFAWCDTQRKSFRSPPLFSLSGG